MTRTRLFLEWLVILGCSCAIVWWACATGATARYDDQLLDYASGLRASPAARDVVVVAIDERSLAQEGRWPWDRKKLALLVDRLSEAGARAIVLDILLVEASSPESDAALSNSIARSGRVALVKSFAPAQDRASGVDVLAPLPEFAAGAMTIGHVALDPDSDGIARRVPLIVNDGRLRHDHVQLALARRLAILRAEPEMISGRDTVWPVMPMRPSGAYQAIPATSVMRGEVPTPFIKDTIVIVGATAAGLGDTHGVPAYAGTIMAGTEIQANLFQDLRSGEYIRGIAGGVWLAACMVPVLLLFLGFWRLSPARCLTLALTLAFGFAICSMLMAVHLGLWVPPGPALLAILAAYPLWGWRRLSAVNDFLMSEAGKLALRGDNRSEVMSGGFDNVAKQISRLHYLVDEVAERRAFLTNVIEAAPDAICVFSADGKLSLMNGRARKIFGDDTPGLAFEDLVSSVCGSISQDFRELTLPSGATFSVATSPDANGVVAGSIRVVALVDISDMRRAEEERGRMLEFLSHDMRSPQVAIIGLASEPEEAGEESLKLARIRAHARRTLKLADDFVQLARLSQVPLAIEDTDLVTIAGEAADRAWFDARQKGVILRQSCPDDAVFIAADGHVLSRAIDNLLGNALRYSPVGSTVDVHVRCEAGEAGEAVIEIADQGPGLPPERREDPFRRFGARDTNGGMGAGLGLAFVQAAVTRNGGAITCETGAEGGTRFVLRFALLA